MKEQWILTGSDDQLDSLVLQRPRAPEAIRGSAVLTVREVCRRLHKSRRQIYRYLRAGRLRPRARILGQWLFAEADVARATHERLPRRLRSFFWDAELSTLSPEAHEAFILARLLEFGDRRALRWVFHTYSRREIVHFLRHRGAEVLSRRTWNFWALQMGLASRSRQRSWRHLGQALGGA